MKDANLHDTFILLTGGLPSVFKDYCRSAMLWAESAPMDSAIMTTFTKDGSSLSLLQMDSTSQTGEHLKRHLPDFCGANLVVAVIHCQGSQQAMDAYGELQFRPSIGHGREGEGATEPKLL